MTDRRRRSRDGGTDYASALVRASGRVPVDAVDWERFHARLAERAELSLARLRYPQVASRVGVQSSRVLSVAGAPWWMHAARWARPIVTASLAAGLALIMVVRASPKEVAEPVVVSAATTSESLDRTRAAFDSAAVGRSGWTMESALLPSATDLLIPLGRGALTE